MRKAAAVFILSLFATGLASAVEDASLEKMRQTAEQGNVDAQLEMGILYEFGFNMPKNNVTALAWYLRAAENGNALAVRRSEVLKAQMTPDEVGAAQKLSRELVTDKTEKITEKTESVPATPGDQK
jgi:TPR repeat protein